MPHFSYEHVSRLFHEADLLDDHLKLRKKPRHLEDFEADENKADPNKPKPGTKRSRSYYPVTLSNEFKSVLLNTQTCFLYRYEKK